MFGNENDRPYEFNVDTASTATMAFVIGRCATRSPCPSASTCSGIRYRPSRWPPPPVPPSCARSSPAPTPLTWGRGRPMPARRCATATGWAGTTSRCSTTSRPSSPTASTAARLPDRARSAVFSSIPDAVLVSGQITGEAAKMADLEAVKKVLPDTPVLANTGVKHATVADVLQDRRRLHRRLVAEGRRRHLERHRPRPRRRISWPRSARRAGASDARQPARRSLPT